MAKEKVLIIAYYFPPMGGGGVQRTAKFAKYLAELGWEPIILTVHDAIYSKTNRPLDYTLLDDIPQNVKIARTNAIDLGRMSSSIKSAKTKKPTIKSFINKIGGLLINPDAQMLWIPVAINRALNLVRKFDINIIYTTANPWSDHIIGLMLKHITGLPWIADYRDPWNINPYQPHTSKIRQHIQLYLETQVIKTADKVVFATGGMQNDYHKFFRCEKFVTIRNGYDPDDFISIKPITSSKFNILYSGSIWHYRRPTYFFSAVSNWLKRYPQVKDDFMITFLGKIDNKTKLFIEKENLLDIVNLPGYRSHRESISFLLGADVLLLNIDEGGESILTGKIFEYFASGKPILALVPPSGIAAQCLKEEGRNINIVNPRDVQAIEKQLEILYNQYKKGSLSIYKTTNLKKYTRRHMTGKLSKLFSELLSRS